MLEYIGLITCVIVVLVVIWFIMGAISKDDQTTLYSAAVSMFVIVLSGIIFAQTKQIKDLRGQIPEKVEMEMISSLDYSFMSTDEINDSLLYLVLDYYDVTDPKYVMAQAHLESGHFTSDVFKNNNNFLGLYDSKHHCYFSFNSWQDCVRGYVNSIQYRKRPQEKHIDFLKRIGYAEDPAYIAKVNKVYKSL